MSILLKTEAEEVRCPRITDRRFSQGFQRRVGSLEAGICCHKLPRGWGTSKSREEGLRASNNTELGTAGW